MGAASKTTKPPSDDRASGKSNRETWLDWLPPGHTEPGLITRAELLKTLADRGVGVSERELRYWEAAGALPAPVRRFHRGAIHALYPSWHANVVWAVPKLRAAGLSLPASRPKVREVFDAYAARRAHSELGPSETSAPPLPTELVSALHAFATELRVVHNLDVADIALQLYTTDRQSLQYFVNPSADNIASKQFTLDQ